MQRHPSVHSFYSSRETAAVSDVIGSMLLVAVTVGATAGFGLLILNIEGPPPVIHVALEATIGPGADGDWGPGDAELRLGHLGGMPLPDDGLNVQLVYPNGGAITFEPTFIGGALVIGQEWVQVISAEENQEINIRVFIDGGRASQFLLETGDTAVSGTFFLETFVNGRTVVNGTVASFAGAKSANDGDLAALLSEEDTSGAPPAEISGQSTSDSGALNPGNVLVADDQYATLPDANDWVQAATFPNPPSSPVTQVLIGFDGLKTVAPSNVAHQVTVQNHRAGGNTISTPLVAAQAGHFYIAAIANGDGTERSVTGVNGLSLVWSQVAAQCNSRNTGCIEVWRGTGIATAGVVTASFSGNVDDSAIAVSGYSGVNLANPILDSTADEHPSDGSQPWSSSPVNGVNGGLLYVALNGHNREATSWSNPTEQRASVGQANEVWLLAADGGSVDGANTASGTLVGGSDDWHLVALTLNPAPVGSTTATISYSLSGTPSANTRTVTLTESEQEFVHDVTADRAWATSDMAQLAVRVTASTTGGADIEVDHIFVRVTTASGAATFSLNMTLDFTGIPSGDHELQMRYRLNPAGESYTVEVGDGTTWRSCPGTLSAVAYAVYPCTLLASDINSGAMKVRLRDADVTSTSQSAIELEYARVTTT